MARERKTAGNRKPLAEEVRLPGILPSTLSSHSGDRPDRPERQSVGATPDGSVVGRRALAILTVATLLAFAYNSASPVGIRFGNSAGNGLSTGVEKPARTNSPAESIASAKPTLPAPPAVVAMPNAEGPPPGTAAPTPAKSAGTALNSVPEASAALVTNPAPVTWAVLKPRLATGQVLLLDARAKAPYEAGHIPGAILLSIFSSTDEFAAFRKTYPTNTPLAVYCGSASCPLSQLLADRLVKEFGYQHVEHMTTGYLEWQDSEKGKPEVTVSPAAPPPIAADTSGPMPSLVIWEAAQVRVARGELTLVDIRTAPEYAAGHLPGAVSLPAESSSAVIAEFRTNQRSSKPILIYGTWTGSSQTFNHARRLLKEHGFGRVECLHDGFIDLRLKSAAKAPKI